MADYEVFLDIPQVKPLGFHLSGTPPHEALIVKEIYRGSFLARFNSALDAHLENVRSRLLSSSSIPRKKGAKAKPSSDARAAADKSAPSEAEEGADLSAAARADDTSTSVPNVHAADENAAHDPQSADDVSSESSLELVVLDQNIPSDPSKQKRKAGKLKRDSGYQAWLNEIDWAQLVLANSHDSTRGARSSDRHGSPPGNDFSKTGPRGTAGSTASSKPAARGEHHGAGAGPRALLALPVQRGDLVLCVNHKDVRFLHSSLELTALFAERPLLLKLRKPVQNLLQHPSHREHWRRIFIDIGKGVGGTLGFELVTAPPQPLLVKSVAIQGWAAASGVRRGDELVAVGEKTARTMKGAHLTKIMETRRPLTLAFVQNTLSPQEQRKRIKSLRQGERDRTKDCGRGNGTVGGGDPGAPAPAAEVIGSRVVHTGETEKASSSSIQGSSQTGVVLSSPTGGSSSAPPPAKNSNQADAPGWSASDPAAELSGTTSAAERRPGLGGGGDESAPRRLVRLGGWDESARVCFVSQVRGRVGCQVRGLWCARRRGKHASGRTRRRLWAPA